MLALLLSHLVLDVSPPLWLLPSIFPLLHSCSLVASREKAQDRFPAALAQLLCSFHIWCTETNSAAENVRIAGNMSGDCEMRAAKASVSSPITLCLLEHEAEHIEGVVLMPNELQRSHGRESCAVMMERAEHCARAVPRRTGQPWPLLRLPAQLPWSRSGVRVVPHWAAGTPAEWDEDTSSRMKTGFLKTSCKIPVGVNENPSLWENVHASLKLLFVATLKNDFKIPV